MVTRSSSTAKIVTVMIQLMFESAMYINNGLAALLTVIIYQSR